MWQFADTSWEQDDAAQSFRLSQYHGNACSVAPAAPLSLLVRAKTHKVPNAALACSQGVFPAEFNSCPYCGAVLCSNEPASATWIPPYGTGNGLKVLSRQVNPFSSVSAKGKPLSLPSAHGRFSFCSVFLGAKQRLLIALQRDIGKLSVLQPGVASKWCQLEGRVGEDSLPEWSWSIAADSAETGLAIPGNDGPAWITVDWARNTLLVDRGAGRSVGGVAKLGCCLLAPVQCGERFAVLSRMDGDENWSECKALSDDAAVAPQLRGKKDQPACFGVPFVDETRMVVYWPCRGGYIKVTEAATAAAHAWDFRPWETDEHPAVALVELGPPYRKAGSRSGYWQLCEDHDPHRRDKTVNKIVKLDGDERADSEVLEYGQFVTTGRASFTWLYDFWADVHQFNSNAGEQSELRYPLLQFGEKGLALVAKVRPWQGREDMGLFSDIFFNRLERSSVFVRFVFEGAGIPERVLYAEGVEGTDGLAGSLFRLSLAQLAEVSVFVYQSSLCIYLPEENHCFRWPLELVEAS